MGGACLLAPAHFCGSAGELGPRRARRWDGPAAHAPEGPVAGSSRDVAEYLSSRGPLFGSSFKVSHFVLFSARASVGGGPYVVEADYPLAA